MQSLKLKWCKIGYRPYYGDYNNWSDKEIQIGYFKEGFATHVFQNLVTECKVINDGNM